MINFIIVGTPRSGTTMLVNSLNSIQGITCFGEILTDKVPDNSTLNHWQKEMIEQRQQKIKNCFGTGKKDNSDKSLCGFLDYTFAKDSIVGLKMLYQNYEKNKNILEDYFRNRDIRFIYVHRNNIVKQAISHKLKKSKKFEEKKYIDPSGLKSKCDEIKQMNDKILELINDYSYITVGYEDMTGDKEISKMPKNISRKIFNFINFDTGIKEIPVNIKKHWPSKLEDRITNKNEIEIALNYNE